MHVYDWIIAIGWRMENVEFCVSYCFVDEFAVSYCLMNKFAHQLVILGPHVSCRNFFRVERESRSWISSWDMSILATVCQDHNLGYSQPYECFY